MAEAMGLLGGLATTMFGSFIPFTMYLTCFRDDLATLQQAGWATATLVVTVLGIWASIVSAAELGDKV